MSNLVLSAPEGKSIPIIEAGMYSAVCVGIIDIGEQFNKNYENYSRQVVIQWELPDELIEIDGEQKPRMLSETYTASLGEKANLRKVLESWRGKQFTDEELRGFDLENVLGATCMLNVTHMTNAQGKTFAKIAAVTRLPKGYIPATTETEMRIFSLSDAGALETMKTLPEWIQKRIEQSRTYEQLTEQFTDIASDNLPF